MNMKIESEMQHSRLIQRLLRPTHETFNGVLMDNLFAFGGGFVNGGMSKQGMEAIKDIFSFDYMGAAEFEFGEVPKALSRMVDVHKELIAFSIKVETKEETSTFDKDRLFLEPVKATVYALCVKSQKDEVTKRIKSFARTPYGHDTKEAILLNQTIRKKTDSDSYCSDYVGWLELNNSYMFFTDKETCEKMCKLFGVSLEEK